MYDIPITYKSFFCQKHGDTDEYQDAYECSLKAKKYRVDGPWRFSIADGATESTFQKIWAQALVKHFVEKGIKSPSQKATTINSIVVNEWLTPIQKQWHDSIDYGPSPKFSAIKKVEEEGALATFLGFEIVKGKDGTRQPRYSWKAYSCGDANLFVVRNNELIFSFPMNNSSEFTNRPNKFLCSLHHPEKQSSISILKESIENKDTFVLCTDALAKWLLTQKEKTRKPWDDILAIKTQRQFGDFICELRINNNEEEQIKNDDTTITIVRIDTLNKRKPHLQNINRGVVHGRKPSKSDMANSKRIFGSHPIS